MALGGVLAGGKKIMLDGRYNMNTNCAIVVGTGAGISTILQNDNILTSAAILGISCYLSDIIAE